MQPQTPTSARSVADSPFRCAANIQQSAAQRSAHISSPSIASVPEKKYYRPFLRVPDHRAVTSQEKTYSPTGTPTSRRPQDLRGLGLPRQHLPSLFIRPWSGGGGGGCSTATENRWRSWDRRVCDNMMATGIRTRYNFIDARTNACAEAKAHVVSAPQMIFGNFHQYSRRPRISRAARFKSRD